MYFTTCIGTSSSLCGVSSLSLSATTTNKTVSISDVGIKDGTACYWSLYTGSEWSDSSQLKVHLHTITNMEVYVTNGTSKETATLAHSKPSGNTMLYFDTNQYVFIVANSWYTSGQVFKYSYMVDGTEATEEETSFYDENKTMIIIVSSAAVGIVLLILTICCCFKCRRQIPIDVEERHTPGDSMEHSDAETSKTHMHGFSKKGQIRYPDDKVQPTASAAKPKDLVIHLR